MTIAYKRDVDPVDDAKEEQQSLSFIPRRFIWAAAARRNPCTALCSLTVDLAGLVENVRGAAREQVAYMVDMAKSDALDLLGETRQAFELVDRHV